jgi:hypothetical protein
MNGKDNNNHSNEEMRLLYQMSVSEIAFFKQQQWRVTNYGLLLYGVIVAIPKILNYNLFTLEYVVLFLISFAVLAVCWFLVGSLEKSLLKSRTRLVKAKDNFGKEFKDAWKRDMSEHDQVRPDDKPSLLWLFRSVTCLGFLIVNWLLYRMSCDI